MPLFPELNALFSIVKPGISCPPGAFVIQRYRCAEANPRAAIHWTADVASMKRWPRPFKVLRARLWTELERTGRFANRVSNGWYGHNGAIAETHCLQTTGDSYAEAFGGNADANIPANPTESSARSDTEKPRKNPLPMPGIGIRAGFCFQYTPQGSNL